MTRLRVDARAAEELAEAARWYENESEGLGVKFLDAFEHALEILREDPTPLSVIPGDASKLGAKRLLLHRFPFSLVVVERKNETVVVAIAHHARRPGYWTDRLGT